jgi:thymidine kinase
MHTELVASKTFDFIKEMNSNRKFAKMYWSKMCLSGKYESLTIPIKKLNDTFKQKSITVNAVIVQDHSNFSIDKKENVNIINMNIRYFRTTFSNKSMLNKYILENNISLIVFDEVNFNGYDKVKHVNKIVITDSSKVMGDYIKYKDYKSIYESCIR